MPNGTLDLARGTLIGGTYRVEGKLGDGAMGVVLSARDTQLERDVAVKLIRPELLHIPVLRTRFLDEARALARVNHPNVLQIYAYGDHEGAPYFVSELVDGATLEDIRVSANLDQARAMAILEQVCHGVAAIHAASTVHRDLKPSNVLVSHDDVVRVADLGVSSMVEVGGPGRGTVVGTPAYMAPEIALQAEVPSAIAHRSDVYSLACMAFELLTGQLPFDAREPMAIMAMHVGGPIPRASEVRPGLSDAFDAVFEQALAKSPEERTPTADAFRRALVAAHQGTLEPVRILIAEDDEDFREALALTLSYEFPDAIIESYPDGTEALEAFDAHPCSVALLDLGMPRLDGLTLTGLLRSRPTAARVPIIVLTAQGGPNEWRRLSALGADGFLVKPVKLPDVVALVRRALKERTSTPPEAPLAAVG